MDPWKLPFLFHYRDLQDLQEYQAQQETLEIQATPVLL